MIIPEHPPSENHRFGTLHHGLFLAVADHFQLAGVHAQANHVVISGAGAAFAQGQVVFLGTAFVAVTFDAHADAGVLLHQFSLGGQHVFVLGLNVELVESKQHATVSDLLDGSTHFGAHVIDIAGGVLGLLGAAETGGEGHNQSKDKSVAFHCVSS